MPNEFTRRLDALLERILAWSNVEMTPFRPIIDWTQADASCARAMGRLQPALAQLRTIVDQYRRPLRVAICGENNAGKSSLVNALTGQRIAVTDFFEFTFCPMVFQYGEHAQALIESRDGTTEPVMADLSKELRRLKDSPRRTSIERIVVRLPLDRLRLYELADVPGIGADEHNAEVARAFHGSADAALFLVDATALGQSEAIRTIRQLALEIETLGIVINKMDEFGMDDAERAVGFMRRQNLGRELPFFVLSTGIVNGAIPAAEADVRRAREWLDELERQFLAPIAEQARQIKATAALGRCQRTLASVVTMLQASHSTARRACDAIDRTCAVWDSQRPAIVQHVDDAIKQWIDASAFQENERQFLSATHRDRRPSHVTAIAGCMFPSTDVDAAKQQVQELVNRVLRAEWSRIDAELDARVRVKLEFNIERTSSRVAQTSRPEVTVIQSHGPADVVRRGVIDGAIAFVTSTIVGTASDYLVSGIVTSVITAATGVGAPLGFVGLAASLTYRFLKGRETNVPVEEAEVVEFAKDCRRWMATELLSAAFGNDPRATIDRHLVGAIERGRREAQNRLWTDSGDRVETLRRMAAHLHGGQSLEQEVRAMRAAASLRGEPLSPTADYTGSSAAAVRARLVFAEPRRYSAADEANFWEDLLSIVTIEDIQIDVVDSLCGPALLSRLRMVPPHAYVRVLTYQAELRAETRAALLRELQVLRESREAAVAVRFVKYRDREGTPLDQFLIAGGDWILHLTHAASAAGERDVTVRNLTDKQRAAATHDLLDPYWRVAEVGESANEPVITADI